MNYGEVPGTLAADGHPIDAYVLGADGPIEACDGEVVAIVRRRDDIEDKLVVILAGEWDAESILRAVHFQEQFFDSYVELPLSEGL